MYEVHSPKLTGLFKIIFHHGLQKEKRIAYMCRLTSID